MQLPSISLKTAVNKLEDSIIEHVIEECSCEGKKCNRCEATLCIEAFHRTKNRKDRRWPICKKCRSASDKQYYQEHTEQIKSRMSSYREANPEKIQQQTKVYLAKYAEEIRERKKEYHRRNADRICAKHRTYYRRNTDRFAVYYKTYYQNNADKVKSRVTQHYREIPEQHRRRMKAYYQRHPEQFNVYSERRRARKAQTGGSYTPQEWKSLKAGYGSVCLCCGRGEPDIKLHADHVVPLSKGGRNDISNIQPLCRFCNSSKGTKTIDYRPAAERRA